MTDSTSCGAGVGDPKGALNFRIGGLFGILFFSLIGFFLPTLFKDRPSLNFTYFLFQAFAAGVVLATGLVHVLVDAIASADNPCLGLSDSFPWALVITVHATILTFFGEHILKRWMARVWSKKNEESEGALESGANSEEEKKAALEAQRLKVVAYTLEAGVIFHSFFVGLTLGTSRDVHFVKGLSFALFFHQGFEGVALGAAVSKANVGRIKTILFGLAFAFVTPIGVAVGILIGSSYNGNDKNFLAAEVAFNSISAGILIYNGIVDIVVPTFEDEGSEALKSVKNTGLGFFFVLLGSFTMSYIAKWA